MRTLTYCTVVALWAVGCGGKAPTPGPGLATGGVSITISGLSTSSSSGSVKQASARTTTAPPNAASEVQSIVLTHTGPDGGGTQTITNLAGTITTNYDALPTGAYAFSATAYDGSTPPVALFASATVPVTVVANTVAAVNLVLQQVVPPGTVTSNSPVITSIATSNASPTAGSTVSLTATVTAPVPTSQLTFSWTSSCSISDANSGGEVFSNPSSLSTNFTSYCTGVDTITLSVTESSSAGGLMAVGSVAVPYTDEGVNVTISFHALPDITSIVAVGNAQPPFGGTVSLAATIQDHVNNDTPTIAWTDDCGGSFAPPNSLTPVWTAPGAPPSGTTPPVACKLTLSVTDGLGGTNSGWLMVNVGEPVLTVPTAAPMGVTATPANQRVTISWPLVTGATSYNLYWSMTAGVTPANGTQIAGVTSPYVQTGLTNGTTYYYVVTGVDAAGESAPSSQVSAVPAAPPSAPTGVTVLPGNQQITLSWAAVLGATSYNLYWSTTTGVTPANGTQIAGVTSPYVQTGLTNGTTYYYVVTAVNPEGESVASSQVSTTPDPPGTIIEFGVPPSGNNLEGITAGPDGALWFAVYTADLIERITTTGYVSEFVVPTSSSVPEDIATGPDGNLWFTEYAGNKIGKITTSGTMTEFVVPTSGGEPLGITAGPDRNLWFTEYGGNKIGQITTGGTMAEFTIPTGGSEPLGVTAGPDGNLWFVEYGANKIGRITTSGTMTEFTVPTSGSEPHEIAAGPDGNLWFTELNGNKIARITPGGVITEFTVPTSDSEPFGIAAGPDGNLWFTEMLGNKLGVITTSGAITEFVIPTSNSYPESIVTGPDGSLWFTEQSGDNIGRITP